MKMTSDSARQLGRLMGSIKATDEDAVAVGLLLETEENFQKFLTWCRSLTQDPTFQACLEKALEIRETFGPEFEE